MNLKPPVTFQGNQPSRPLRMPTRRHFLHKVDARSPVQAMNTVIESWVDVTADLALINSGQSTRSGNQFEVNNRTYGVKTASGRIYPIIGSGFHPLDSEAFRALRIFMAMGETSHTEVVLARAGISEAKRLEALTIYRLHTGQAP